MPSPENGTPMKPEKIGIHRIAELAEVSIGTVDRALHGRSGINEETRARVLRVAERLGYQPNLAARALSIARSDFRIGICVPTEIHFFYDQLWQGILEEAQRFSHLELEFLCRPIKELGKGDADALAYLLNSGVQGVVLTPGNPTEMTPLIDRAESQGIRVICVSTDAPGSAALRSCLPNRRSTDKWLERCSASVCHRVLPLLWLLAWLRPKITARRPRDFARRFLDFALPVGW